MTYNLDEMEALLQTCEADLDTLKNLKQLLQDIFENQEKLDGYYQTQYLQDYETKNSDTHYRILDQDSIWNVISEQHEQKILLLKQLANSL